LHHILMTFYPNRHFYQNFMKIIIKEWCMTIITYF